MDQVDDVPGAVGCVHAGEQQIGFVFERVLTAGGRPLLRGAHGLIEEGTRRPQHSLGSREAALDDRAIAKQLHRACLAIALGQM